MSNCKYNILSNTKFNWWSGWLNKNKDYEVIYNKEWFSITRKSTDGFIPKSWKGV